MSFLDEFAEIVKREEPLAPYTYLKLGGPAEALAQPRSVDELAKLVSRCHESKSYRLLGGGCNLLVSDEGIRGLVIRLSDPAFTGVTIKGNRIRAGAGASLSALISEAAKHAAAGLESLVGIPGTVGGAICTNAGSRTGDISQVLRQVEVMDGQGRIHVREQDDLPVGTLDEVVILAAEFELEPDDPDSILKRMRKFWIHRKAHQPLSFQQSGRIFRDPRGFTADQLIEQTGLKGMRVGGAEVSDRHANFIVAHPGATARDVLRLIDVIRTQVSERTGQALQLDIVIWE